MVRHNFDSTVLDYTWKKNLQNKDKKGANKAEMMRSPLKKVKKEEKDTTTA